MSFKQKLCLTSYMVPLIDVKLVVQISQTFLHTIICMAVCSRGIQQCENTCTSSTAGGAVCLLVILTDAGNTSFQES